MNTRDILHNYCELEPVKELISLVEKNNETIFLQGLCGSGGALTISALYSRFQQPMLIVLPNKEEALYMKSDLENLLLGEPIYFIPETYLKPFQYQRENAMAVQERIETLSSIRKNNKRIVVSYGRAVAEFVIDKVQLTQNSFEIAKGQNLDIDFLLEFLELNEFERVDFVFEPGQFSLRG